MEESPILAVNDFSVHIKTGNKTVLTPVDQVSFTINKGEVIGIVGESGCGKSVMSQSLLRLLERDHPIFYSGQVTFQENSILEMQLSQMYNLCGKEISMIFQDPLSALNPLYPVGSQIEETFKLHKKMSYQERKQETIALLGKIGIHSPAEFIKRYPHELSGGMQQRVMIAMAIACNSKLLIADEPTTALDVTTQAQVLALLKQINEKEQTAILFITHDIDVVKTFCHRVLVMYLGQIVEVIDSENLFVKPLHPYTRALIKATPQKTDEPLVPIAGAVPPLSEIPAGCRFSARCDCADKKCFFEAPALYVNPDGSQVRCWNYEQKTILI